MEYVKSVRPELFRDAVVLNEGGGFPLQINGRSYMMLTVGKRASAGCAYGQKEQEGTASAPGDDQAMQKLAAGLQRIFAAEKHLTCGSRRTQDAMRDIVGSGDWDNRVGADIFGYAGQNSIGMRNYRIGERSNVIPAKAEAVLEFKILPGSSPEDVTEFLERELADCPVQYEIVSFEPGFESSFENSA